MCTPDRDTAVESRSWVSVVGLSIQRSSKTHHPHGGIACTPLLLNSRLSVEGEPMMDHMIDQHASTASSAVNEGIPCCGNAMIIDHSCLARPGIPVECSAMEEPVSF